MSPTIARTALPTALGRRFAIRTAALALASLASLAIGAESRKRPAQNPWADWIEPRTPFFSSVIDARRPNDAGSTNNLTPRALVLNLGENIWAAFDTEMLRVAAVWEGPGVTLKSASQISYQDAGKKAADGEDDLPTPAGLVWLENGLYPGWQSGTTFSPTDPREPAPSPEEIGRGPLSEAQGRFRAVRLTQAGVCLEYLVAGVRIEELPTASHQEGRISFRRTFRIGPSQTTLLLGVGRKLASGSGPEVSVLSAGSDSIASLAGDTATWLVSVAPHAGTVTFSVDVGKRGSGTATFPSTASLPAPSPWPEILTTKGTLGAGPGAYVVDSISLPLDNPWRRNIRLADIQFLRDGRAYAVTFDGDVWRIDGLDSDLKQVKWRRFASGLNEPLSLAVREDEVFVFDRNGIWRLRDTDGDGAADVHEMFSNLAAQSADSREYPNGMKVAPDGSFVIVKGGQVDTYFGKHYGSVIRVSPDGRHFSVLGWGFRQPFIGVNPVTGLVTASDQEGQYVPTTPIQIVEKGQYYGFATRLRANEDHPSAITEPMTWIPRQVNASAASHVWLVGARMGPLNDSLIHLGYNRPEVFSVRFVNRPGRPQASVMSLTRDLSFAPLSGAVNPRDGQLYLTGFRIFATTASDVSGLARLRYTGQPFPLPREVVPTDQGLLLRFEIPLGPEAEQSSRYSVERWNYLRTYKYGSPHYKLDGSLGQERMRPGSVHLSQDRKSVFVALPDMKAGVMQMHLSWSIPAADGTLLDSTVDLTPWELASFHPAEEGFGPIKLSFISHDTTAANATPVTVAEGRRLAAFLGCVACHTADATSSKGLGPNWKSLYGSIQPLTSGESVHVDDAYIRESILTPGAKIVKGFENSMPIYAGIVTEPQIASLILYIKSLR